MRRVWIASATVCALGVTLALALNGLAQRDRKRDHYDLAGVDSELPALLDAHGYTLDSLDVGAGVHLRGMLRAPASEHARVALFFPGNTEPQLRSSLPGLEGMRAGRDLGIASWAYRGFDGSTGRPSAAVADTDAKRALDAVRERFGAGSERIVLVGYSLGSGIALRLAAAMAREGRPPAAIVLMSPYWILPIARPNAFGYFLPSELYRVDDVVRDVKVPTLIVAGAHDQELPVALHARKLAQALGSHATYWELEHNGHVDYLGDASLLARVGSVLLGPS